LVERELPKLEVAGSNPVARSNASAKSARRDEGTVHPGAPSPLDLSQERISSTP
jgi:hypothetical protein